MTNAEIDGIPLLMGIFWAGFSLAYVLFLWIQRASATGYLGRAFADLLGPTGFPIRFAFTLLGLSGALGCAGLVGFLRARVAYSDTAFLLGLMIGILMATLMWRPKKH